MRLIPIVLAAALVGACSTTPKGTAAEAPKYQDAAEAAYQGAVRQLEGHDYVTAVRRFEEVKSKYPYSRFAPLAELRIADALFQQDQFLEAADAYRTFVKLRPSHPEADYAAYREAESLARHMPSDFFILPPSHEKDLTHVGEVIDVLERFLAEYPDSEYLEQARKLRSDARGRLARHELYVADFYRKRAKWRGVAGRLETVISRFGDLGYGAEARVGLAEAWLHFDPPRADDARRLLDEVIGDAEAPAEVKAKARSMVQELPAPDAAATDAPAAEAPATDAPATDAPAP